MAKRTMGAASFVLTLVITAPAHANIQRPALVDLFRTSLERAGNPTHLALWRAMYAQAARRSSDREKLALVDDFFNQNLRYAPDAEIYGVDDYWATPLEFLSKGVGDCEDFAMAKYLTLISLGVPQEKLRLDYVFVRPAGIRLGHVVVTYIGSGAAVVLDSASDKVGGASSSRSLTYVFSFNLGGVSINGKPTSTRYSQWEGLLARMRRQGSVGLAAAG